MAESSITDADEILDIVDQDDAIIGQMRRGDMNTLVPGGGKYVRSADIFIMRSDGKIWVPTRGMHKSIAPGGLDFSVGGHVKSGDTYEDSAIREIEEEAGIVISPSDLEFVAIIPPTERHFSNLYLLRTDREPNLSDEHVSGSWMNIADLEEALQQGVPAKASLISKLELLKEHIRHI